MPATLSVTDSTTTSIGGGPGSRFAVAGVGHRGQAGCRWFAVTPRPAGLGAGQVAAVGRLIVVVGGVLRGSHRWSDLGSLAEVTFRFVVASPSSGGGGLPMESP
jgi:uncharacterized protein YodC (DUF2158 family)